MSLRLTSEALTALFSRPAFKHVWVANHHRNSVSLHMRRPPARNPGVCSSHRRGGLPAPGRGRRRPPDFSPVSRAQRPKPWPGPQGPPLEASLGPCRRGRIAAAARSGLQARRGPPAWSVDPPPSSHRGAFVPVPACDPLPHTRRESWRPFSAVPTQRSPPRRGLPCYPLRRLSHFFFLGHSTGWFYIITRIIISDPLTPQCELREGGASA